MKTNNIVFKLVATIVICLWTTIGLAEVNPTIGQRTQHVFNTVGEAISSVGYKLRSTSNLVKEYANDSLITAKVKKQLFAEPSINSFDISVTTRNGSVTLAGFVTDPEIATKVVQITSNIDSVKWVNDILLIKDKPHRTIKEYISDLTITSQIQVNLLLQKGVPSLSIQVETVDGIVQLTGYVDNLDQQILAEEVVSKVERVQNVKNNLLVKNN